MLLWHFQVLATLMYYSTRFIKSGCIDLSIAFIKFLAQLFDFFTQDHIPLHLLLQTLLRLL